MVCGRQSFINVREAASVYVYDPYSGTRKSGYTRWNHRNKETNSVDAACLSISMAGTDARDHNATDIKCVGTIRQTESCKSLVWCNRYL